MAQNYSGIAAAERRYAQHSRSSQQYINRAANTPRNGAPPPAPQTVPISEPVSEPIPEPPPQEKAPPPQNISPNAQAQPNPMPAMGIRSFLANTDPDKLIILLLIALLLSEGGNYVLAAALAYIIM